jgi:SH3-like domain-containing protein
MRRAIVAMMSTLALAGNFQAVGQQAGQPARSCNISAFVVDQDAHGLNIRAAPSSTARVIQTISNEGSGVAQIRAQNGDWFRVTSIVDYENEERPLFRGDGWVHQSLLDLEAANADPRLYERPAARSRVLARLVPEDGTAKLIGCSGNRAQVRAAGRVGWLSPNGQCSNPLTTCA